MHDFVYMTVEPIHLLPEVSVIVNIIVYSKFSTGNYSIAGKRGHWPASEISRYLTPYFTFVEFDLRRQRGWTGRTREL